MRGSLVIIAALCVVAVAEASSVRFISVDEGQNAKDKADRSRASEGTDPVMKKKVEDAVKKMNGDKEQLEKMVKSLDSDRSAEGETDSEGVKKAASTEKKVGTSDADRSSASDEASEGVKKAASSEKPRIRKRDVRRAVQRLAKNGLKSGALAEGRLVDSENTVLHYLTVEEYLIRTMTQILSYAIDKLENNQQEKARLVSELKKFQKGVDELYSNTISSITSPSWMPPSTAAKKHMRAGDIPALKNTINQRNPFAVIPILASLFNGISGAVSVVDLAQSFASTRSEKPEILPLLDLISELSV